MELIRSKIRLKEFNVEESEGDRIELRVPSCALRDFNLFIGDNAQGKTRLLRILKFIKGLLRDERRGRISTKLVACFKFQLEYEAKTEEISYEIGVLPSNEGNNYIEKIKRNGKILLSTEDKKLFDEKNRKDVETFFAPQNIPAIASIIDDSFETIGLIRDFFSRMLFLDDEGAKRFSFDDKNALVLDSEGVNLSSVLFNWNEKYPFVFNELVEDFKHCFPIVDDVSFKKHPVLPGHVESVLHIHENGLEKDVPIFDLAAGMRRLFSILCLLNTLYESQGKYYHPSLVCIDEVENGLDFKTVKYVMQYLKDYSNEIQVWVTSHSPSIIEFIHPKYWRIVKRKGPLIKITTPEVEKDLDEQLVFFRQKHWDFYTKHISNSELYQPD